MLYLFLLTPWLLVACSKDTSAPTGPSIEPSKPSAKTTANADDSENPDWFQDILDAFTDSSTNTSTPDTPDTSFTIELVYPSDLPDSLIHSAHKAKERLETVITASLPNVGDIDDLLVHITVVDSIEGGFVGWGEPTAIRPISGLPYEGEIHIAASFIDNPLLDKLVLHELVHVMGFGTISTWKAYRKFNFWHGWYYTGRQALDVLEQLNPSFGSLRGFLLSSDGGHWRRTGLGDELMIDGWWYPYRAPLTAITLASLEDIGYQIDYTQAETYESVWGAPKPTDTPLLLCKHSQNSY